MEAIELAGRPALALPLLEDPLETLRAMAASLLAGSAASEDVRAALTEGLKDRSRAVRQACLTSLLQMGDEGAGDLALTMLDGGQRDMEIGRVLSRWEAHLPRGIIVGAVLRKDEVIIPKPDTIVRAKDRVVIFSTPEAIRDVEKIFAVSLEFF